ncbi:hypothetical protein [Pseudomonas spirodelae]|uniref:Uncharacterized protein n=1 Tax=Pseudomonas spirodelae TaxID=3101751 RepID=A0ABU5P6W3_9PSED|nr:hypothetical protein [Pseudomonas sp. T5W1]MEA1605409.1 hypothetical protein [Pseudomonas sp. T5W1]
MALAMVDVDAVIGEGAIANANATVDHDASLSQSPTLALVFSWQTVYRLLPEPGCRLGLVQGI